MMTSQVFKSVCATSMAWVARSSVLQVRGPVVGVWVHAHRMHSTVEVPVPVLECPRRTHMDWAWLKPGTLSTVNFEVPELPAV